MEINILLFRMINDLGKQYPYFNPFFVFVAEYILYFVIISALLFLILRINRNRLMVFCSILSVIVAELLGKVAGMLHFNNQPFAELTNVNQLVEKAVNNSFPSDHTIIVFTICLSFWAFKRGWNFLWIVLAMLVGISRIWVGVHYPGDVIMGVLLSMIAVILVYRYIPRLSFVEKWFGKYDGVKVLEVGSETKMEK